MPNIEIPPIGAALTANGTAAGVITLTSTAGWYPGQQAWISNSTPISRRVLILEILSATTMRARIIPNAGYDIASAPNYTAGSDLSAFTTVLTSRLDAPRQLVPVDQPTFSKLTAVP